MLVRLLTKISHQNVTVEDAALITHREILKPLSSQQIQENKPSKAKETIKAAIISYIAEISSGRVPTHHVKRQYH